VYLLGLLPAI